MPFKKSVEKAAKEIVEAKEAELDGTATQSSEGWSGRPSRAIDGNTNQNYGKASCSHTAIGDKDPWWKLDLGSPKLVTKVQVWNRVGCCSNRLSGVKISVDGAVCGALSGATSVQTVACNKKGQDVKFSMPRSNDYLTLCEVKVWGVPTPKPIKVIEEKIEKEEVAEVAEVVAEVVPVVEATLPPKAIEKIVPKVINCRKVLMDCIRKARSAIKCFRSQPCQCQRSKALKKKCEEKEKAVEVEDPKETGAKIPETRPPCPMMKCMFLPKPGCKLVQSGEKDAAGCLKHPCGQQKCEPTAEPTEAPTTQPTTDPTEEPSAEPTEAPTTQPTTDPTEEPTADPTEVPTAEPTLRPTDVPTTMDPTTDEPSFAPTSTPTHKPTAVPTGTPTELPTALPTRAPIQPAGCPAAGAGWKLVRHVPAGNSWHPARDQLTGTSVYGSPANSGNAWSVKFSSTPFNEFLFATGDCKKWLIAKKDQVLGWYSNGQRQILKSSTHSSPYTAAWYRRQGALEDPWISLNDHHPAIGQGNILYGENNFGSTHASAILPRHGGANVYIR